MITDVVNVKKKVMMELMVKIKKLLGFLMVSSKLTLEFMKNIENLGGHYAII